ncbi:MAG TPA: hypothetical protein VFQ67_09265 [Allosphingosinicella sp.]|nr:hypothetical protein [Allosphingosinicella sp.]
MTGADTEGPTGPFLEAVGAGTLAAAAMLGAVFLLDGSEVAAPPLPIIFLFAPIAAALVVALAAALIGLPLTWLLQRSRSEAPWTYPAAGLVAGAAVMTGFFGIGADGGRPAGEWLLIASVGAVPGLVCGAAWWLRYRRHLQAGPGG